MDNIGVLQSSYDSRDYKIKTLKQFPEVYTCPCQVPVKNQGSKPTCVAHAVASVTEYHYKKQHDEQYVPFSTEFIYGMREDDYYIGDGMVIRDALKTLVNYGDVPKAEFKGNNNYQRAMERVAADLDRLIGLAAPHKIAAYYRCYTINEIKTALMSHGPVLASMTTYKNSKIVQDFYTYDKNAEASGRHCIIIYGWDERGWLIQNSWGQLYAGDGKFHLPFDYSFNETWGVSDTFKEDEIKAKNNNIFLNIIYKILNYLVNFIKNMELK